MKEDYQSLSVVYIFLEQTIKDENVKDEGNYTIRFRKFCIKLQNTLCQIALSMENRELNPPTRSAMPDKYRNSDRQTDYWRDYRLMKNSQKLLNTLMIKYQAILNIHNIFTR